MEGFSSEHVVLAGDGGFFLSEEYILKPGITYSIGRSSSADISIKKTHRYAHLEEDGILLDDGFRSVSRIHFTMRVQDDCEFADTSSQLRVRVRGSVKVEIHSLSRNGITVDGAKATDVIIPELSAGPHIIEFGAGERFKLFLRRIP
ncbi:MAG: FHA domain-containing protein [Candidatus Brocadiia bacterium]